MATSSSGIFGSVIKLTAGVAERQRAARQWFRNTANTVATASPTRLMAQDPGRLVNTINRYSVGKMYCFFYNPKHRKTLPYYDTFPLIFPLRVHGGRILGINMHYLHPVLRAKLMDALYDTINNNKFDDTTRLKISYQILKAASKFKYFRPCIHTYLFSHVKSRFYHVRASEWDQVLMLPMERFQKQPKTKVWQESLAKVK